MFRWGICTARVCTGAIRTKATQLGRYHDQEFHASVNVILQHIAEYDWYAMHVNPTQVVTSDIATEENIVPVAPTTCADKGSGSFSRLKQIWMHVKNTLTNLAGS